MSNSENGMDFSSEDFILTGENLMALDTPVNLVALPADIAEKIDDARQYLRAPYVIDRTQYDTVFITSDIHSDLIKLDMLLINAGIIESVERDEIEGMSETVAMIYGREWVANRTLVIIVGDIVDGRRNSDQYEVPDPKGNMELLLHAYLYNLRLMAESHGSELRFTIGNHDYHSVIVENETNYPYFYESWVHATAQNFFITRAGRRACLLPFYNCCPYLMLTISNEVACVHGGFIGYDGTQFGNMRGVAIAIQDQLDAAGNFSPIETNTQPVLSLITTGNPNSGFELGPLWSRAYAYLPEADVCASLAATYPMVVVGHCQTGRDCCINGQHTDRILSRPEYRRHACHVYGSCVLTGCRGADGIPKLAFVDIAMSRAFPTTRPAISRAEILKLEHIPTLAGTRYYNQMTRINAGGDGGVDEPVWAAPVIAIGGRRRRLSKRKSRRGKVRRTYKPKRRL